MVFCLLSFLKIVKTEKRPPVFSFPYDTFTITFAVFTAEAL